MSRQFARRPTRVSRPVLIVALSLLVACGADKAPTTSVTTTEPSNVHVDLAIESMGIATPDVDAMTSPLLICIVNLTATVSGSGVGTWVDGEFRVYDVRDTTRQLASIPLSGPDLLGAWGTGSAKAGDVEKSHWELQGPTPFIGELAMRYTPSQSAPVQNAVMRFRCAPQILPGAAKPSAPQISVTPSSGSLEAGSPITIKVTGAAEAGAYFTYIKITGPCFIERGFREQFQQNVSRTVTVPLPYPCTLGTPIRVDAVVYDALTYAAADGSVFPISLSDTTHPRIFPQFMQAFGDWSLVPSGTYSPGDTLIAYVRTADNYRMGTLYWELLPVGVKDSVVVAGALAVGDGALFDHTIRIGLPAASSGKSVQVRIYARDANGLSSDTTTTPLDSIRVR
jgi:hypothetical protein